MLNVNFQGEGLVTDLVSLADLESVPQNIPEVSDLILPDQVQNTPLTIA